MGAHGTPGAPAASWRIGCRLQENVLHSGSIIWYDRRGGIERHHQELQEPAMTIPAPAAELLERALVAELTVVDPKGRPITYPLIPLWDGERIYMTSSTLFSRKLEHIGRDARVSVSVTDPVSVGGRTDRVTVQGIARVIADDPHGGWERLLPIWSAKEPAIVAFLKARVALPLFFERALIEITPRRVLYWSDGDTSATPNVTDLGKEAA
jgi:general stress protein 26